MSTVVFDSRRRVFAVGHFPPPVHGMAVATARFTALLEERSRVITLDISGRTHGRSTGHHLVRIARTSKAIVTLARRGRRGDRLYLACDAGPGKLYTIAVLLAARLKRCDRYLHHHSYAYLSRRSALMAVLVRVAGPGTVHIATCPAQAALLSERYPGARTTRVLPITYVLDEPLADAAVAPPLAGRRIVLGHLSNLTVEKGLRRAAATLEELVAAGLDAELVLAGPSPTVADAADLAEVVDDGNGRVTHVGAVGGDDKDAFFDRIDVFLFPTLYRNESFGIVAAEAMAHGVPVIAYRAGCLDAVWVGDGGLVIDHDEDFATVAATQVQTWVDDQAAFTAAGHSALRRAQAARREGNEAAAALADALCDC